jgi:hypothetical protein
VQFGVLCIAKYCYGEKNFHRNVKIFPVREIRYQINSLQTVFVWKKSPGRAKEICLHQGCHFANLGDFSPKKSKEILFKKCGEPYTF